MMKIRRYFISIVSHGHLELITSNESLKLINKLENVFVTVKDNLADPALEIYCKLSEFGYLQSKKPVGFGENNNDVFEHFNEQYKINDADYFLVVNPDVIITVEEFIKLMSLLEDVEGGVYAVNLFSDGSLTTPELSLRKYPNYLSLLKMLVAKPVCSAYDKNVLKEFEQIDWASGAFLIFSSSIFKQLGGFDTTYFMYYEDVDICYRYMRASGQRIKYLKSIKAVHKGAYQNRKLFSRHFRWYISSLLKFLARK